MELELGQQLIKLFFSAPVAEGILVMEDNAYLGVVLKKDIEIGLREKKFRFFEAINTPRLQDVPDILFKKDIKGSFTLPVVDKTGALIRIITYDEFLSHFDYPHFVGRFRFGPVFDALDAPFLVTNHFKRILYANKAAIAIAEDDLPGKPIAPFLKRFEISSVKAPLMVMEHDGVSYNLFITHAESPSFAYILYQFFRF